MSQTIRRYTTSTNITKAYKCQYCNYQCIWKSELKKHLEGMHSGTVYKCKICSKEYKWQRSLTRHIIEMHEVKVYKCYFCGEEYKWINSLKQHMKKYEGHDDEIRYQSKVHIRPLFTDPIEIYKLNIPTIRKLEMLVSLKNHVQYNIDCLQDKY